MGKSPDWAVPHLHLKKLPWESQLFRSDAGFRAWCCTGYALGSPWDSVSECGRTATNVWPECGLQWINDGHSFLPLLSLSGEILFSCPGTWVGLVTCLDHKNVPDVTLCRIADQAFKRTGSFCFLRLKSQLPCGREAVKLEDHMERGLGDERPSWMTPLIP